VRAAVQQIGYVRCQAGWELRSGANTTLGFSASRIAQGPFAGEMIRGAQDAAWHNGYLLMIVETGHDRRLIREAVTRFAQRRAHRIIYASVSHQQVKLPPELARANPILANAYDQERRFSSFVPDELGGGILATRALLANHRAPVGLINVDREPARTGRLRGYRAALEEAGQPCDDTYVVQTALGLVNAVDGYKAVRVLFRRLPDIRSCTRLPPRDHQRTAP
jgi:LacI family transcriptional regulator